MSADNRWVYRGHVHTSEPVVVASMRCPVCGKSRFARFTKMDDLKPVVAVDEAGSLLITCERHGLADVFAMSHGLTKTR